MNKNLKGTRTLIIFIAFVVAVTLISFGAAIDTRARVSMRDIKEGSRKEEQLTLSQKIAVKSAIAKEDCRLCSDLAMERLPELGQNNLGYVDLNTFDYLLIELNPYKNGEKMNELDGWASTATLYSKDKGSDFSCSAYLGRQFAVGTVSLGENSRFDLKKTRKLLCDECLNALVDQYVYSEGRLDGAIINFQDRKLVPLEKTSGRFVFDDFYVAAYCKNTHEIDLYFIYAPL